MVLSEICELALCLKRSVGTFRMNGSRKDIFSEVRQHSRASFPLLYFSFRVVGKIYFVHFHKTTIKIIALLYSINCLKKYFLNTLNCLAFMKRNHTI
jgi:hypothetical protein